MPDNQALRQTWLVTRREIRHGKMTFLLSVLTTMLATTMLTAVLGLGESMRATLARDARTILGGHFDLRLTARDFNDEELGWLNGNVDRLSKVTFVRAAAFADDLTTLIQLRAVDDAYPLFGELGLADKAPYQHDTLLQEIDGAVPALVSEGVAKSLGIDIGGRFELGSAALEIVGLVSKIPDPNSTMMLNAPVVLIAGKNLPATGLHLPGVLKSERVRVDIGSRDAILWREEINASFAESDWRIRGTDRVVPGLQNMIGRMETLMLLVSLGTMLIAGICVGNTVSTYLRGRITSIAILRSLGMPARRIRLSYWLVSMLFVLTGALLGLPVGLIGEHAILEFLSSYLPFEVTSSFSYRNAILIPAIAIMVGWIFAERPLQIFSRTNPTTLFSLSSGQAHVEGKLPRSAMLTTLIPGALLTITLALLAQDTLFLFYFGVGGVAATICFRWLAIGMIKVAGRLKPKNASNKIALRSVARGGDQIISASVSLGVGLTALLTFTLTEANFRHQLKANLAVKSPDYYLAGLQKGDEETLRAATSSWIKQDDDLRLLPTQRAKITHLNGVPVEELDPPEDVDWIVRGDRFVTWAKDPANQWTGSSRVSEGEDWAADDERLLVSFDAEAAEAFNLKIGDPIVVRILGKEYELTIANLRRIDWTTFDVNFVMVLSDGPWENEPHGYLGSARNVVGDHFAFQRKVVETAPSVTPIRTKTIVESVTNMLSKIGLLLNLITVTATVSGVLVLAAAIAEGRHRRAHESVVLRILGTSRQVLSSIFRVEFIAISSLAIVPSLTVAMVASYSITDLLLSIPWQPDWLTAALVLAGTMAVVLFLGTLSTMKLIATPPLQLLHNN